MYIFFIFKLSTHEIQLTRKYRTFGIRTLFGDHDLWGKGFWTAIGELPQNAVDELVKGSVDAGINFIDTANVYSEGLSEEMTGKTIRNLGLNRHDLVSATKVRGKREKAPTKPA